MRHALVVVIATAAGLGACAPVPGPYGYAPAPAPASYGYYDEGYAPGPVYAEPGYAPYVSPGPTIIVGGERRFDRGDRYRYERPREDYERPRNEGAFRGNPNPPGRDFGRAQEPRNFGGSRPGPQPSPQPVAIARPGPQNIAPPPSGGRAFEQWSRTHVNASPSQSDNGPR